MTQRTNILLVDDIDYTRELLRSAIIACIDDDEMPLQPQFFQTSNGESVLDLIKARNIDLVYLDIDLDGTNGLDILKDIKNEHKDVAVIMCSGESSSDNVMEAIKNGANGFIVKPFNSGRVSESLKKYLLLKDKK
ncbi:response regulator [Paraglaciecola aquimarina]|uniref:Response regulator n=1 Tax=Paraglaciecola algarum TaxID=3050085 RepID=A0ABS9D6P2_9ALTE|nr:response regulator [Paraglaciecola sp. G1-23]MCF2947692.1 response regulator [Paraglaciecola sp. G1-23]